MGITDSKSGTPFLTLTYGRDSNSLLTSDSGTNYGYDPLNRVTGAASTSYQYDKADQLTQMAVTGGNTTTQTYDIAGQLKTSNVTNGQTQVSRLSFSFDANGNRTRTVDQNNVNTTLGYDAANRLTNYNGSGSYAYNGDGLRVSKSVSGSTTSQTWDTAEGLPTLVQDGGLAYITGAGGLPLEQVSGSTVYWYHEDQLGSVRAITDASGVVQQTYGYDAYGNLASISGSLTNPFRFAGQFLDGESGFYYLRARYLDPSTGEFISADPALSLTRAPFTYASDSPLDVVDSSGLMDDIDDSGGGGGIAGGNPFEGLGESVNGLCSALRARISQLINRAGNEPDRNGLTRAGRSYQKHSSRPNSSYPPPTDRTADGYNTAGGSVLDQITSDPHAETQIRPGTSGGAALEIRGGGYGARVYANGSFGFLE